MSTRDRRRDEDLDARLARLPREIPPRRDLWPEIARRLEAAEPREGTGRRRKLTNPFGAPWRGPAVLVAAGLAAVVLAGVLLLPRPGGGGAPGDGGRQAAAPGEIGHRATASGAPGEGGPAGDVAESREAAAGRLAAEETGEAIVPPTVPRRRTPSAVESAPRMAAAPPPVPPETAVAVDPVPEADRRAVRRLIDERLATLPPETAREVRGSLAALDAAAREVEAGVAARPADVGARLLQAELVRREVELLGRLQTAGELVAG